LLRRPRLHSRHVKLIACVLSLALLFAQLGAEAHAYSHFTTDTHGAPATQLCGACLSVAPLQGAAGPTTCILPLADWLSIFTIAAESVIQARHPSAQFYRSRAPPRVLPVR
jgi:hypothetical protein